MDARQNNLRRTNDLIYKSKNLSTNQSYKPKPPWLRVKAPHGLKTGAVEQIMRDNNLKTVCEEAACPNIGECWSKKHATFMILGSICTRSCAFCNVTTGKPNAPDPHEPSKIAKAAMETELKHIVITSVDRDDLEDGGASQFINCIKEIRAKSNDTTIEILTPDFRHKGIKPIEQVADSMPDVFNHNIETVPRLYPSIRPGARYFHSLNLLYQVKQRQPSIFTKSGFMVGLGETSNEIIQILDDLRSAEVDFVTIGQYLQPTKNHAPIDRYVTPEEFNYYKDIAVAKGFLMVASSPLTRSSYHADEDFIILREKREAKLRAMQSPA